MIDIIGLFEAIAIVLVIWTAVHIIVELATHPKR